MTTVTAPRRRFGTRQWSVCCVLALAVFQVLIAILVYVNRNAVTNAFVGHSFAPTLAIARTAVLGTLVMHLLLAVLTGVLAYALPRAGRATRLLGTILLAVIAVGGIAAMTLPNQTYLSPIGSALALAGLVLMWLPSSRIR